MTDKKIKSLKKQMIIRFSMLPLFIGLTILLPAGTIRYWQVYAYFGALILPVIFTLNYFLKHNPEFLIRRSRMKEKELTQKLLVSLSSLVYLAGFIIPGLDKRYSWSSVPLFLIILADIFILLSYVFIFFVFKENSYASRVIEEEEGQKVISTGPYSHVRHPMYLGVLVMFIMTPIALDSWWGLIPWSSIPLILIIRILNEEKVLKEQLPGYKEYCKKVRFRLIPGIW